MQKACQDEESIVDNVVYSNPYVISSCKKYVWVERTIDGFPNHTMYRVDRYGNISMGETYHALGVMTRKFQMDDEQPIQTYGYATKHS